jgi:hypothetical protein
LIALEVVHEGLGGQVSQRLLELTEVLDGVCPLPLGALPLLRGHVAISGKAAPVGLDELPLQRVAERLIGRVSVRLAVAGSLGVHRSSLNKIGHGAPF